MAIGNLIYVGKSRLRRKFRDQKIESRLKRIERRLSDREQKRASNGSDYQEYDLLQTENADKGFDANNNARNNCYTEEHSCHFCDNFECDSWYSRSDSSSDSEDIIPLIDTISLRPTYTKMPFNFPFGKKKKAPENEPIKEADKPEEVKEIQNEIIKENGIIKEDEIIKEEEKVTEQVEEKKEEVKEEAQKDEVDADIPKEEAAAVDENKADIETPRACETIVEEKETQTTELHEEGLKNGGFEVPKHEYENGLEMDSTTTKKKGRKNISSEHPGQMLCCTIM